MSTAGKIVVLQSRLASTRLPAKALLPILGMPTVRLCASRAANSGLKVIIATSEMPTDDGIREALADRFEVFRGDHLNVLLRYVQATSVFPEDTIVVRLTADNLFPDGTFIEDVVRQFELAGVDYVSTGSLQSGLPYGMSVEVFRVGILRRAHREARHPFDREHVTPWVKRNCTVHRYIVAGSSPHWARLRCTLDTFEDFSIISRVFDGVDDPTRIGWRELLVRLTPLTLAGAAPRCPYRQTPDERVHSVVTLGSAQFGADYGIANTVGMPSEIETKEILDYAADAGVTSIDTASVYGRSEERIGKLLPRNYIDQMRVITKLDVLANVPSDATSDRVGDAVEVSVYKSLYRLRTERLDSLLLHRWSHYHAWGGAAWRRLLQLKANGLIGTLGASVSYPWEAIEALSDPDVGHIQCPVNLLDWRWQESDFLGRLARRPDVVIHARSTLLQGMLALPPSKWIDHDGNSTRICEILDEMSIEFGRADRLDLCLAYVASLPWVTSMVIGVDRVAQLEENLRRVQSANLSPATMSEVRTRLPRVSERLLNPALWKQTNV